MAGEEPSYEVRRMSPEEVSPAYSLIEQEDFGLSREKHALLYKTFPEAFFVIVSKSGEVVGTVSFAETIPKVFELGYMVTKSTLRGQGVGRQLVDGVRKILDPTTVAATLGPGTKKFYTRIGFQPSTTLKAHLIFIMIVDRKTLVANAPDLPNITSAVLGEDEPIDELVAYDALSRTYDNRRFVEFMARFYKVLVARDSVTKNIVGFVAATKHYRQNILVIEGLYADSDDIAHHLFKEAFVEFPTMSMVKIQTFEPRTYLSQLGDVYRKIVADKYTVGEVQAVPENKVYCVCDSEFTL